MREQRCNTAASRSRSTGFMRYAAAPRAQAMSWSSSAVATCPRSRADGCWAFLEGWRSRPDGCARDRTTSRRGVANLRVRLGRVGAERPGSHPPATTALDRVVQGRYSSDAFATAFRRQRKSRHCRHVALATRPGGPSAGTDSRHPFDLRQQSKRPVTRSDRRRPRRGADAPRGRRAPAARRPAAAPSPAGTWVRSDRPRRTRPRR